MSTQIKLGDRAKDKISGFSGIVVARTEWLHGCRRLTLQPEKLDSGKVIPTETFDERSCEQVKAAVFTPVVGVETPAGDRTGPVRQKDPSR